MSESYLISACIKLLAFYYNQNRILWYIRIFTGHAKAYRKYRTKQGQQKQYTSYINGAKTGTPDIQVLLNNGNTLWLECKSQKGILSDEQKTFKQRIQSYANHIHLSLRDVSDLKSFLDTKGE